jgi:phage terminase Nu1 subunit (DNA packaging protein)
MKKAKYPRLETRRLSELAPNKPTISWETLENWTGLTDRRMRQLTKEGYFPDPVQGEYKFHETIRGLIRHYQTITSKYTGDRARIQLDRERSRARLEKARANIAEIKEARMRNELLPAAAVEAVWSARVLLTRQRVLQLPLSESQKHEILEELRTVPVEEYLSAKQYENDF